MFQEDNATKVGDQLKPHNTRSCIQFCFRNLGLHPKNIFCYPGQRVGDHNPRGMQQNPVTKIVNWQTYSFIQIVIIGYGGIKYICIFYRLEKSHLSHPAILVLWKLVMLVQLAEFPICTLTLSCCKMHFKTPILVLHFIIKWKTWPRKGLLTSDLIWITCNSTKY